MTHFLKCGNEKCATCLPVRQMNCEMFSIAAPVKDEDSNRRTSLFIPKTAELPNEMEKDGKKESSPISTCGIVAEYRLETVTEVEEKEI